MSLGEDVAFIDTASESARVTEANEAIANHQLRRDPNDGIFTQSHGRTIGECGLAQDTTMELGRSRHRSQTPEAQNQVLHPQPVRAPGDPGRSLPKRRRINSTSDGEVQLGYDYNHVQPQRVQSRDLMPPPVRPHHTMGTRSTAMGVSKSHLFKSNSSKDVNHSLELLDSISSMSSAPNSRAYETHSFEQHGPSPWHGYYKVSRPVTSTATIQLLTNAVHEMHGFEQPGQSFRAPHLTTSTASTRRMDTPAQRGPSAEFMGTPNHLGTPVSLYRLSGQARRDSGYHFQGNEDHLGQPNNGLRVSLRPCEHRAQSPRLQETSETQPSSQLPSSNRRSSTALEQQNAAQTVVGIAHSNTNTGSSVRGNQSSHVDQQCHNGSPPFQSLNTENFFDLFVVPSYQPPETTRSPYRRELQTVHADGELDELRGQRISQSRSTSTVHNSPIRPLRISIPLSRTPVRGRSPVRHSTGISNNMRSSVNHHRTAIASRHRIPLGSPRSPNRHIAFSPYFTASGSEETLPPYSARATPSYTTLPRYPQENPPQYVENRPRPPSTWPSFSNAMSLLPSALRPASNRRAARR